MNPYREKFGHKKRVFPVVHVRDCGQVCRNIGHAIDAEADGVFLIDHSGTAEDDRLIKICEQFIAHFSTLWIGANFLGYNNRLSIKIAGMLGLDAVWTDNAGHLGKEEDWMDQLNKELEIQITSASDTLYFGGFAFKGQDQPDDIEGALLTARGYVDVITTSGEVTGQAASVEKLALMREILGDHPLATASGVTPENAHEQFRFIDAALVSTGVCANFFEFDPDKLKRLVHVAKSL